MAENSKKGIVEPTGQTVTWNIVFCRHWEIVYWSEDGQYHCKYCGRVAEVRFIENGWVWRQT
jgi:hypothetical protein